MNKHRYFEGWYFKNVSAHGEHSWSFIPGISLTKEQSHAFVQAINGTTGKTFYFRFDISQCSFLRDRFQVRIGNNLFSDKGFSLDLDDGVNRFSGQLEFSEMTRHKATLRRPGIMGWYRYVPLMECYHGVVSLDHKLSGSLRCNDEDINFNNGRGYIEKDWGSSMPESWIWMQSNHFEKPGTSFMLSVARIPWIGKTFTGFLGYFHHLGKTITFATYTGAKIRIADYSTNSVNISIKSGSVQIEITGHNQSAAPLMAPVMGEMERVIHESINAVLNVRITNKAGEILFEGAGINGGMEMAGEMSLLL
ncbi:MAG: tocopherol cyclase family protein [Bacteroidales bacterium]